MTKTFTVEIELDDPKDPDDVDWFKEIDETWVRDVLESSADVAVNVTVKETTVKS
jgi:hypothetical protein